MFRRLLLGCALTACGGGIATTGDASADASVVDGSVEASNEAGDAPASGPCDAKNIGGCFVKPFECYPGERPSLADLEKKYAGLAPTDECNTGSIWVERYEACGLVEIHSFQGPPLSYWFDKKTGTLVGVTSVSDTTCAGYGTFSFPCDGIVTCKHLCGPATGTVEAPHCPPPKDAGPG